MSSQLDCLAVDCGRVEPLAPPAPRSYAGVDLMAKDFDSLLRAVLDQIPRLAPGWADRSEADSGMVYLELFAYACDQLSYLQDRVALEGFLRTATQVESVRKLLRLIDYTMYPGHAAETYVVFECDGNAPLFVPAGFQVGTRASTGSTAVRYETVEDAVLHTALSRVTLSVNAPSTPDRLQAVLQTNLAGALVPGAWLLFEQGDTREWAQVVAAVFAAATTTVTLAEPLEHTYTVVGNPPARVHGNRVRATHGVSHVLQESGTGAPGQGIAPDLAPITFVLDPVERRPVSTLSVTVDGDPWIEVDDFIDSDAAARHYRVSRDNDGFVTVHFGDGVFGAAPALDSRIVVRCRIGIGREGHVGRDTLTEFDRSYSFPDPSQRIERVRNPFAARPPRDPQSLHEAKLLGPAQLRVQNRAVVPEDFERLLGGGVWVDDTLVAPLQSRARTRHTGSWHTVVVSVDMPDRSPIDAATRAAFESLLAEKKMAGLDVRVEDARYCPVHIGLLVEVEREHFARDVRSAVEHALVGQAGQAGFFAPGRLRFGQPVYLSDLYAAVTGVPGVQSVAVMRFKRLGDRYPDNEAQGFIPVGSLEVARLDNDPDAPENGVLSVRTCGGKEG